VYEAQVTAFHIVYRHWVAAARAVDNKGHRRTAQGDKLAAIQLRIHNEFHRRLRAAGIEVES
jgi:hypothetical protein